MKLVKEHMEDSLNELKSEDVFIENKYIFQSMITKTMKRFGLSKDIAVMMLAKALETASYEMPDH